MRSHILSFETPKKQERVVGGDRLRWSGLSRAGGLVGVPGGTSVIGTDSVTFARITRKLGSHQLLAKSHSLAHIYATISTTLILHFLTESCRTFTCFSCPVIMISIISLDAATCWGQLLTESWERDDRNSFG